MKKIIQQLHTILIDLQKIIPIVLKKKKQLFCLHTVISYLHPYISLDQLDTNKALVAYQMFIDEYPDSERLAEANIHYKELKFKLEKKAFEIGKTYYKTAQTDFRNYKSAIVAFDNLINDFLGTKLKEEALYFRFKAYHDLVIVSTERKKLNRIKDAIAAYDKLVRNFPESKFLKDSDKLLSEIKNEEKQLVKS